MDTYGHVRTLYHVSLLLTERILIEKKICRAKVIKPYEDDVSIISKSANQKILRLIKLLAYTNYTVQFFEGYLLLC